MGNNFIRLDPTQLLMVFPVDHPIGKAAGRAKIGVVFHTHYSGDDLATCKHEQVLRKGSTDALSGSK